VTRAVGTVQDLIVEDGEIESKTKADRMCWRKLSDGDIRGSLVCFERLVRRVFPLIASGEFSEVTVVITLPNNRVGKLRNIATKCTYILW
jgi:hypothetical protein